MNSMDNKDDEKIRGAIIHFISHTPTVPKGTINKKNMLTWLEKQGEQKPNPYSGTSFEYNGHIWGMCARDNGVDILCDKHIIGHFEMHGKEKIKTRNNRVLDGLVLESWRTRESPST